MHFFQDISNPHDFVKPISERMTFNVNNDSDIDSDSDVLGLVIVCSFRSYAFFFSTSVIRMIW